MVGVAAMSCYHSWQRAPFRTPTSSSDRTVAPRTPFALPSFPPYFEHSKQTTPVRSRKKDSRPKSSSDNLNSSTSSETDSIVLTGSRQSRKLLLYERCNGQLVSRYWADEESGALRKEDTDTSDRQSMAGKSLEDQERLGLPIRIPQYLRTFVLPSGFPDSVSSDYLTYMLWQFPTNVTGWMCSTLVTSSLLKAVGIGGGGGSAAAASAAIKWVSKDGLGSVGRLFIGGRFGSVFDEDPKQWRMYADFIGSAGSLFELATPLAPGSFLLLASLGNLTKAVAKGLKDPSFRVIQNHFAVSENLGDVVAKEEVWGVAAQLVGLALGVLLLGSPGILSSFWELVTAWASIRTLHLWLRYQTLAVLRFNTINYKRACILIEAFISGATIPGCDACNVREQILMPRVLLGPRVRVGSSLHELLGPQPSTSEVRRLLSLYEQERYLLLLHPNTIHGLEARIVLKEGADSVTLLRSLYQACWILQQIHQPVPHSGQDSKGHGRLESLEGGNSLKFDDQLAALSRSISETQDNFDTFVSRVKEQGWLLSKLVIKIPSNASFLSESQTK